MNDDAPEIDPSEAASLLERFVIDNDALGDLEREIGRFNIFDSLRIVDKEIRHSNFLAWLLDPAESHGLGQLFLRAVLMDLLRSAPRGDRPMSPVDLDGADLVGVRVEREWRNIDLLIVAEDPKIVIAIENKIWSDEHSKQLNRYRETVVKEFSSHRPLFVFLTVEGKEPSDENWTPYSYSQLHAALDRCRRLHSDTIGREVGVFLDHYLRIVRSRFMDDEKITELCNRIYTNHRQALDLIFERKADPRRRVVAAFADALSEGGDFWIWHVSGYECQFMPAEWKSIVPDIAKYRRLSPSALLEGVLMATPYTIEFQVRVSPSTDPEARAKLIAKIQEGTGEHGLKINGKVTTEWTNVRPKDTRKRPDGVVDDEQTLALVVKWAQEARPIMESITPLLREVFPTA